MTTKELSGMVQKAENDVLEILHVLKSAGNVLEIEIGVWMHGENMTKLLKALKSHFDSQNEMNIADFKSISGLTRKFAIPVLEYCDKQDWTERDGNLRLKGTEL